MSLEIGLEKEKLRDKFLQLRKALSKPERLTKDGIIAHKLARLLHHAHANPSQPLKFGAYVPFEDEVNPFLELLRILEEKHIRYELAVPFFKTKPRHFKFLKPTSIQQFKSFMQDTQGVDAWVCHTSLWTESNTQTIPYWVIPGICFSKDGKRIGFGSGFYDEWLAGQPGLFIGVAYDVQIIETITPEPFDIPMDVVLTEYHTYIRPEAISEYPGLLSGLK